MRSSCSLIAAVSLLTACGAKTDVSPNEADYLYVWTASADTTQPDFLAVFDVTEDSARYGSVVTTVPVPGLRNVPHHTEHEMPADGQLFVNGFGSGQTFVFNTSEPAAPMVAAQFGEMDGLQHPHSYVRLPNGNVLATFQMRHDSGMRAGGIAEITPAGQMVRTSSADYPGADSALRAYSAAIVPALDRIVTTSTDMDADHPASRSLQVWRLSTLELLHTFTLPDGPAGGESMYTAEPRLLSDGRTVLVSTFNCSLYLLDGLDTGSPSGRLVNTFPRSDGTYCAIPIVAGPYYLITVPAWHAVVSLDVSNPAAPREVSRLTLGANDTPHWIAMSPDKRRIVITGSDSLEGKVLIARFDSTTGALSLDQRFREEGSNAAGFTMTGKTWPHGGSAAGVPHGAVFGRKSR